MLEGQQLLQQLQHLLPQLQSKMAVQGSAWQGDGLLKAHVALLWAMCCMHQCSRASPEGSTGTPDGSTRSPEAKGMLLAPLISTLPQVCMPGKAVTAFLEVTPSLVMLSTDCREMYRQFAYAS